MFEIITKEHEAKFDEILASRHSVRSFQTTKIEPQYIEKIIRAGIVAPFAAIPAAGTDDFRKFYAISTTSSTFGVLSKAIDHRIHQHMEEAEKHFGGHAYVHAIRQADKYGIRAMIGKAPTLLITVERKGIPSNANESLCFCMQNMWLRATSLGIGFRFVALMSQIGLENDAQFCRILGIEPNQYVICACELGYPDTSFTPAPVTYPDYEKTVRFVD